MQKKTEHLDLHSVAQTGETTTQTYFPSIVQVPFLPVLSGTPTALWINGSSWHSVRHPPKCSCGLTERKVIRLPRVSDDFGISPSHKQMTRHGTCLNDVKCL